MCTPVPANRKSWALGENDAHIYKEEVQSNNSLQKLGFVTVHFDS